MPTIHKLPELNQDPLPVAFQSDQELRRRNQEAIDLLDSWERDGDEAEQRATMDVLRKALGENRETSCRPIFP